MKIWRIEYADGNGPYTSGDQLSRELQSKHSDYKHPGLVSDCKVGHPYVCGFPSLKSYLKWFDERFRAQLHDNGAFLTLYKIKKQPLTIYQKMSFSLDDFGKYYTIHKGKKQLGFLKLYATLIGKYDPNITTSKLKDLVAL